MNGDTCDVLTVRLIPVNGVYIKLYNQRHRCIISRTSGVSYKGYSTLYPFCKTEKYISIKYFKK